MTTPPVFEDLPPMLLGRLAEIDDEIAALRAEIQTSRNVTRPLKTAMVCLAAGIAAAVAICLLVSVIADAAYTRGRVSGWGEARRTGTLRPNIPEPRLSINPSPEPTGPAPVEPMSSIAIPENRPALAGYGIAPPAGPAPASPANDAPIATASAAEPAPAQPSLEDMFVLAMTLPGIRPAPKAGEPEGMMFFDPRCPYCHAAWTALRTSGHDLLWIPVAALGPEDPARSAVAAVLTGNGTAALDGAFAASRATAAMTPELQAKADETSAGFLTLLRSWPGRVEGVPAWIVRTGGGIRIGSGWPAPAGLLEEAGTGPDGHGVHR